MSQQILIIENDREWHDMLREIVDSMGYESHVVHRATEAFKILDETVISLILLDIKMPVVHGDTNSYATYANRANACPSSSCRLI